MFSNSGAVASVECQCAGKYKGEKCDISPCDAKPCFQGVTCTLTADNLDFTCGACPVLDGIEYTGNGITCTRILNYIYPYI